MSDIKKNKATYIYFFNKPSFRSHQQAINAHSDLSATVPFAYPLTYKDHKL